MKLIKQIPFYLCCALLGLSFLISSCKDDDVIEPTVWLFEPATDNQEKVQEALILMENNDIIEFSEGTFEFTSTLSLDGKSGVIIRGAGREKTTLSFATQTAGAEGFQITNANWFLMRDLTVADAIGDNIKIKDSDGVTFLDMGAVYNGPVSGDNGAYALYPVACKNVYIDGCYVRGASDAGIYVGQTEKIVVRNNFVEENVAGIEIENCIEADVYNNEATNNTGGILVFDLPNLPVIVNGKQCRVYNNNVHDNAHPNFALSGTVQDIPPGTGIMLLSSADVEVFDNQIINNNVMGLGIVSMITLDILGGNSITEYGDYDPFIGNIHIHDNTFQRTTEYPAEPNDMGALLTNEFPDGDMRDILYDGIVSPGLSGDTTEGICIHDNVNVTYVDINAIGSFTNKRFDATIHDCIKDPIAAAEINAPAYE